MSNDELKKAGLKVTLPRLRILEILEKAGTQHMSAEDVYKRTLELGEDIGLATVYRVLTQFEEAGLVVRHHFEGGYSVFEIDHGTHNHLVCVKCGRVEEFVEETLEEQQKKVAKKAGFVIAERSLTLYGFCPRCQQD